MDPISSQPSPFGQPVFPNPSGRIAFSSPTGTPSRLGTPLEIASGTAQGVNVVGQQPAYFSQQYPTQADYLMMADADRKQRERLKGAVPSSSRSTRSQVSGTSRSAPAATAAAERPKAPCDCAQCRAACDCPECRRTRQSSKRAASPPTARRTPSPPIVGSAAPARANQSATGERSYFGSGLLALLAAAIWCVPCWYVVATMHANANAMSAKGGAQALVGLWLITTVVAALGGIGFFIGGIASLGRTNS
jgi:hypothetical protein